MQVHRRTRGEQPQHTQGKVLLRIYPTLFLVPDRFTVPVPLAVVKVPQEVPTFSQLLARALSIYLLFVFFGPSHRQKVRTFQP
jgi:hypothetical protein